VLPTGIVPITAVPTVVRHGERLRARVRMRGTDWVDIDAAALEQYVSEEHNPENARGVRAVEVISPAPLLARGMCLVDTPGISSVFAGNTAATEEFLPHVDVALVVVGVDPPLTGDELSLVEAVARHAPAVLVVLNKADRFGDAERAQAAAFASRALSVRLDRTVGPVYQVSATNALHAANHDSASAATFGWSALCAALADLEHTSGRQLVRQAHDRGVARLARQLRAEIDERPWCGRSRSRSATSPTSRRRSARWRTASASSRRCSPPSSSGWSDCSPRVGAHISRMHSPRRGSR
jgi:hypothetical protein